MAVQIPDPGTGNGQTGDNEYVFRKKVKDNFSDQTNAASRLVGPAAGNLMEVGAFGLGGNAQRFNGLSLTEFINNLGGQSKFCGGETVGPAGLPNYSAGIHIHANDSNMYFTASALDGNVSVLTWLDNKTPSLMRVWTNKNATRDPNGFLKGASPIAEIYSDKMDLNQDATEQGGITFEKLGTGDYLVKGSLGFAQEGWYIETPKDANGNVLVAVVYEQLANNDLSIKTYAKKFDDETGDIVANLTKPRDIPTGRFISLRLHELPKEPPVMPTESQPEV